MDQHIALHGDGWPAAWLRTCGLAGEATTLDNLYQEFQQESKR
jgi:hypothetical protein